MRVFIGIELDQRTKKYIREVQGKVRKHCEKGRFTMSDNFHLTLKFLGEIDEAQLSGIIDAMDKAVNDTSPFEIGLDRVDYFQKKNRRILWVGSKSSSELEALASTVENTMEAIGFEPDNRPYQAHITLGRQVKLKADDVLSETSVEWRPIIDNITLFESKRVDDVLRYVPIKRFALEQ